MRPSGHASCMRRARRILVSSTTPATAALVVALATALATALAAGPAAGPAGATVAAPDARATPFSSSPVPADDPGPGVHVPVPVLRAVPEAGTGVWPLDPEPEVVEAFRPPASAYGPGHRGVDLAGHRGQRVRAALSGRVAFAGTVAGRGVVVVNHGEFRTTYEPVAASVGVGEAVATGQVIGSLEWFGSHCPPSACLHWGLLEGDLYRDPLTLVGTGPVRLLPLAGAPPIPGGSAFGGGTLPGSPTVWAQDPAAGQARGWAWR